MKYFSKAKLGKIYIERENEVIAIVDEIVIDKENSYVSSLSTMSSPPKVLKDQYSHPDYDENFNEIPKSKLWREFYLETEFNLGDGFIDTGNGVFYEVEKIHAYWDNQNFGRAKIDVSYTICDVKGRTIMFNGEILSDHVKRGLFKYVKINNEVNDVVEEDVIDVLFKNNEEEN